MELYERDKELDGLGGAFASAVAGVGTTVMVSGEAGMGKSALLGALLAGQEAAKSARLLGVIPDSQT